MSIEHIIPQKINTTKTEGGHWHNVLSNGSFDYLSSIHKIGNLTLSTKKMNSEMRNNIFAVKKTEFAKSTLQINKNYQF